jgi:hypothetical protein
LLKEMGLGLVLMLAGDGEVARRAGDALIRDQVDDALTEGGFDAVDFGTWDKGFDGARFWVGFTDVRVERGGAVLDATSAVIFPMSIEMRFERGTVATGDGQPTWRFGGVDVDGAFALFSKQVGIAGADLRVDGDAGALGEPFCVFDRPCGRPLRIDGGRIDAFRLEFSRSGRNADVAFAWRSGERCARAHVDGVRIDRGDALSAVGRALLRGEYDGQLRVAQARCTQVDDPNEEIGDDEGVWGPWSRRDRTLDPMLHVLLVSVPEAYEYLVE